MNFLMELKEQSGTRDRAKKCSKWTYKKEGGWCHQSADFERTAVNSTDVVRSTNKTQYDVAASEGSNLYSGSIGCTARLLFRYPTILENIGKVC